jgi:hypothetical protein
MSIGGEKEVLMARVVAWWGLGRALCSWIAEAMTKVCEKLDPRNLVAEQRLEQSTP